MDKLNQVNVMVKHEQSLAPAQPVSKLARSMWARWVFISLAWLCIALGILGIFIPGLPTVDFMILAVSLRLEALKNFINGFEIIVISVHSFVSGKNIGVFPKGEIHLDLKYESGCGTDDLDHSASVVCLSGNFMYGWGIGVDVA